MDLSRQLAAEGLATAFLVAAVVGSGIMGERLAAGNVALALLANTLATGATLVALILTFGPISGAHLNPVVSFAEALRGRLPWRGAAAYGIAQIGGGVGGTLVAHVMFAMPLVQVATHDRSGGPLFASEIVATFGLVTLIQLVSHHRVTSAPYAVGAYITGAYWFTASTSFANPAVTMARMFSDTFAGIRPADVPGFIAAQFLGAFLATHLCQWLLIAPAWHARRVTNTVFQTKQP